MLAANALGGTGPTAGLFRGEGLPVGLTPEELIAAGAEIEPTADCAAVARRSDHGERSTRVATAGRRARGRSPSATARCPHLEGRLPAVGGILEHVVEHEQPARHHVRRPRLVVGERDVERVTAVDEQQPERRGPRAGDGRRRRRSTAITTSSSPASSIVRRNHGSVSMRPVRGSTSALVVVLPPGLVLLRPAVVVDGEQHGAARPSGGAEVDRRLAAVRADLEQRPDAAAVEPGVVQREALVVGHEPDRGAGVLQQHRVHHVRSTTRCYGAAS